ncbi:phosphatidylglycerol lysyltransferase domain-containing protein [Thetidibacter halocola]|uniref:DUF2156 domain-containing protein n=1 Tax=Thetidibacter halocola TaxID=2827239 RepID=A0A8J7WC33_9RHOB|nr:phosphatidylglycerol lysyltransferase domain-containing protein [Thetidibacter halocola]MBS0122681.1 DUF2156 domain-containing protein [Thetidibacter halocola]
MQDRIPARMRAASQRAFPVLLGAVCAWLLMRQAGTLDWSSVGAAIQAIPPGRWALALLATAGSFWALAQYDAVAHRHLETGAPDGPARRAGAASIALGQVIGFGPAVGAAVRWRLMPSLGHGAILRLTGFVTLSFFAAWGVWVLGLALPMVGGAAWLALPVLPALGLGGALALWRFPVLRLGRVALRLPSIPAAARLLALCLLDLVCAGLALWLLLPAGTAPALPVFVAAYALAMGAGLVGGTPGGVGPFELALLALLPMVDPVALAAAILGYRLVYYAVPAVLGAVYATLARPLAMLPQPRSAPVHLSGPRAEAAVAAQASVQALRSATAGACLLRTPHSLTLFLGAQHGPISDLLAPLRAEARRQNRVACLYKVTARDAAAARRAGWIAAPHSTEAVLDPRAFDLDAPDRRQLRRALRKADRAGVSVERMTAPDWPALAEVNTAWAQAHGGERGLTMGRFCSSYLRDKPLFVARHQGRIVGFVTAVAAPGERCLDLMRHRPEAPAGTMHALVHALIRSAAREGCHEVCLAALPAPRLMRFAPGSEGLARFKSSFAPSWRPLYIAAPGRTALLLAALDLWRAVCRPEPLPPPAPSTSDWTGPQAPAQDADSAVRLAG